METKNIILIAIVILVIVLACVGAYIYTNNDSALTETLDSLDHNATDVIEVNDTVEVNNTTVVGDNSPLENLSENSTSDYKVYNPQSDSYVHVIGEKFDEEVNRWYTYDEDGVRYYNTRINQG